MLAIVNDFIDLLLELSKHKNQNFSGAGIVLYKNINLLSKYHCDLVNDSQISMPLKLGTHNLISYLLEISSYQHPYHDGFHFINGNGVLTHVAQFFSPPVSKPMPNILGQGARTFCSQCGSTIKGVVMVGSISSSSKIYLFENGKLVNKSFLYDFA